MEENTEVKEEKDPFVASQAQDVEFKSDVQIQKKMAMIVRVWKL